MILQFLYELLKIGHSAGSLITEALALFKTFQRLSATKSFTVHFTKDCLKMFSWAKNLIQVIMSNFYVRKLSEMELLYLYNYAFPIFLVVFIVLLSTSYRFYLHLFISFLFLVIGYSLSYIPASKIFLKTAFPISAVILLITIIIISCKGSWKYFFGEEIQSGSRITFTFSLFNSLLIGAALLFPFTFQSTYFLSCTLFIIEILTGVSFIVEIIIASILRKRDEKEKKEKEEKNEEYQYEYNIYFIPTVLTFINNLFPLLIIPCTEHFIEVMKGKLKNNWQMILGYLTIGIILPVLDTLFLVLFDYSDFADKYRESNEDGKECRFIFYELADIIKQIVYAIAAAYDQPIVCMCIEIAWLLAVLIPRPYKNVSDHILQGGSSLIIIISNVLAIVCKYKKTGFLSFEWSLTLVIVACIPAIISLYVYFAVDFEYDEKFDIFDIIESFAEKSFYNEEVLLIISIYYKIAMPFVILFFGIYLPIFVIFALTFGRDANL